MRFVVLRATVNLVRVGLSANRLCVVEAVRQRSSYYGEAKSIVPKFIRSYVYRHPKSPFFAILVILVVIITQPLWHVVYAKLTLDREDYMDYREFTNQIALQRARYGTNIYIPFYQPKDDRLERFEFFHQRTLDRHTGKEVKPLENISELLPPLIDPEKK